LSKKRSKIKDKTNPFIISDSEIANHYNLLVSKSDISMRSVHEALRPDLIAFLTKRPKASSKKINSNSVVPYDDYKRWIMKIDKKGFDYPILLSK